MKRIFSILVSLLALGSLFSCTEIYPTLNADGIPSASDLIVRHTIDEKNIVSFYVDNKGVIPYFIFHDGTTASGQGAKHQYMDAGDYSVEVKAINANGMSDGSKVYKFNVPTTYYPPFDPTPFLNFLTGGSTKTWVMANDVPGHMGCGPDAANAGGWWSAPPDDKKDWSVYDNTLTFGSDYSYIFDPVDGQIYVNQGCTYESSHNPGDGNDYLAPCEIQNTTFQLSGVTGVETKITFPKGTTIGYIPNDAAINNPEFLITELTADKLVLVSVTEGICWQFIFKPFSSGPDTKDLLAGTWSIANEIKGHMGCGPDAGNPAGWWSAEPDEKAAWSVYDNTLTFTTDGKYIFDPVDGQIYVNFGCSYESSYYLGDKNDYLAPYAKLETTYEITDDGVNKSLVLPANSTIGYIPNDESFANPVFIIRELTEERLVLVSDKPGVIAWQFIFKRSGPTKPKAPAYDSEENLWKAADAAHTIEQYYADAGWAARPNPTVTEDAGSYTFTYPLATADQWQAQFKILPNSLATESAKNYGLSVTLLSTTNLTGVTIKMGSKTQANEEPHMFLSPREFPLLGGVPVTYTFPTAAAGIDDEVELVFDFGGCPDNTTITISNIVLWEVK